MKINGAYKFRTKANVFPSFKICFLGQYQDRESGDTNFYFFVATPDKEIEEVTIENSYSEAFFTPKVEEVYFQNIGNQKTDWVATYTCSWDTSLNEQEGELKILLGYKVGETATNEKPKEYNSIETDPKYLVNTVAQRKFGTLEPIGGGDFVGCFPLGWQRHRQTAHDTGGYPSYIDSATVYFNDELYAESSSSVSFFLGGGGYKISGWNTDVKVYPISSYFYFYNNSGLTEETLTPSFSLNKNYSRSWRQDFTIPESGYIDISFDLSGSGLIYEELGSILVGLINNINQDRIFGPTTISNDYLPIRTASLKYKYWLTDSDSFLSTFTASHNYAGNGTAKGNNAAQNIDLQYNAVLSNNWDCKTFSTFLTRNLNYSFLIENQESASFSDITGGTTLNSSYSSDYTTSIYLVSLESGTKEKIYECSVLATSSSFYSHYQYVRRYYTRPLFPWDGYRYGGINQFNPITNISYASTDGFWGGVRSYSSQIQEEAMMLFLKAISHRDKSTLRGDYLYYVENDVFDPINTFLTQEYTVDVLVFDIKDIEKYIRKQVRMKPSKIPEGMEGLTITKIMAMQYLE
jgi:hypothetical protein